MADVFAMSFGVPNYSGLLFNKGNTRTPLSAAIGGRRKYTDHVEFVTGQEFTSGGGSQPAISESASLTAPYASVVTREQKTNVTQIYQEALGVSYGKMSNMGTLSGLNAAGQVANPQSELDFQVAAKMNKIAADIEYTFINGVYQKATADNEANKTRGLCAAITSNVIAKGGEALGIWDLAEMLSAIRSNGGYTDGLVLWCDATTMLQINADAENNGLTVVPAARDVNGIALSSIVTPLGVIYVRLGEYLPSGTALVLNLDVSSPVEMIVPDHGNFFLEELAKTGAGTKYQIFGQIGLDYGPEFYHGKFTGIATTFDKPLARKVMVAGPVETIEVDAKPVSATLNKTTVAADNTATVSVASVEYNVYPATDPSVAYLWQIRAKTGTTWADLTSSYTGYNTDTLTVKAADAEKHYRCKVTASGSATGTVYSNECDVAASA